jgi:hypothetical protein
MEQKQCDERHKSVDEKLIRHEKWLGEHETKIDVLTKSDATNTTKIDNLCSQIAGLTKSIWGLVISLLSVLVGFFIWYVQTKGG